jgi:hypothetical protein
VVDEDFNGTSELFEGLWMSKLIPLGHFALLVVGCCHGVRLPSQNCGLGPTVLFPGDSNVDLVDAIGYG